MKMIFFYLLKVVREKAAFYQEYKRIEIGCLVNSLRFEPSFILE